VTHAGLSGLRALLGASWWRFFVWTTCHQPGKVYGVASGISEGICLLEQGMQRSVAPSPGSDRMGVWREDAV